MKATDVTKEMQGISELAYIGNIGFTEMVKFQKVATRAQKKKMDRAVADENWNAFKAIIKKVVGVSLK